MAAGDSIPEVMLKTLECTVCLLYYNSTTREARSLKCGHTFCKSCIDMLQIKQFTKCPTCRKETHSEKIVVNFVVKELVSTMCESCHRRTSMQGCAHGADQLCEVCSDEHMKLFYETTQADVKGLTEEIQTTIDAMNRHEKLCKERLRDRSQTALEKVRKIVRTRHDELSNIQKQLEGDIFKFQKQNQYKAQEWKTTAEGNISKAKDFLATATITFKEAYTKNVTGSEISKANETCSLLKETLRNTKTSVPTFSDFSYVMPQVPANSVSKLVGFIGSAINEVPSYRLVQKQVYMCDSQRSFHDVAFAPNGSVVAVDTHNDRMSILDKNLNISFTFGATGNKYDEFCKPVAACVNSDDEIFVADRNNHRIQVYSTNGTFHRSFGRFGPTEKVVHAPVGLALGPDGRIYVADAMSRSVKIFKDNGTFVRGFGKFSEKPNDVAVTLDNKILVTYAAENKPCSVHNSDGICVAEYPKSAGAYGCYSLSAVNLDPKGNIIFADDTGQRLIITDNGGQVFKILRHNEGCGSRGFGVGHGRIVLCVGEKLVAFQ